MREANQNMVIKRFQVQSKRDCSSSTHAISCRHAISITVVAAGVDCGNRRGAAGAHAQGLNHARHGACSEHGAGTG